MSEDVKTQIGFDQFSAIDLRVAKVVEASDHPNADKLTVLTIDLGPLGQRQIVAGIKQFYKPDELVGKNIAVVVNLAPRTMRGVESQAMLLAAVESGENAPPTNVVLLQTDKPVPPGTRIS